jgi:hypothetical protein
LAAEVTDGRVVTRGRRGMVLVAAGLGLQLVATFHWTPATFVLSAAVGIPLVLLGAALFGVAVLRAPIRGDGS